MTLPASGHMRVTVSPTAGVTVDYVKTYLPGNGTNGEIARSYTIPPPGVVTHTLTYAAGAHGSISGVSPQTVVDGGDGTPVEAIPDYRLPLRGLERRIDRQSSHRHRRDGGRRRDRQLRGRLCSRHP